MNILDMILLGLENLNRSKLRTFLTTLGVVVGIGALTSMVAFGTGLQKNITDEFKNNDVFTSLIVSQADVTRLQQADVQELKEMREKELTPLNDSVVQKIKQMEGIKLAFAQLTFPVKVQFNNEESRTDVQALPVEMGDYKPYNDLMSGSFFDSDSANTIIVKESQLKDLKIILKSETSTELSPEQKGQGFQLLSPDSVVGKKITLVSAVLDPSKVMFNPMGMNNADKNLPFTEIEREFTISGVLQNTNSFTGSTLRGGIIMAYQTAQKFPKMKIKSVWDFLGKNKSEYSSVYAKVQDMDDMPQVKEEIEDMGLSVFTFSDKLDEMKRGFLIMDAILGAVGTIALFVAALGIINTMVMSILERTREIGIMKSIGGSEKEIRMIFFIEAASIGLLGAIFGILLGWVVTRIANVVVNTQMLQQGQAPVNLFYFPWWLILGAVVFSILVSLAAGLYPAVRAARIDPVKALRHD